MDYEELDKEEPDLNKKGTDIDISIKPRKAFRKLTTELTTEELSSPGVQKLLLEEIERLGKKESQLDTFQDTYYETSKENAVLKEKIKNSTSQEFLYTAMITISSLIIGLSKNLVADISGIIVIVAGVVLLVCGWLFKFYKK